MKFFFVYLLYILVPLISAFSCVDSGMTLKNQIRRTDVDVLTTDGKFISQLIFSDGVKTTLMGEAEDKGIIVRTESPEDNDPQVFEVPQMASSQASCVLVEGIKDYLYYVVKPDSDQSLVKIVSINFDSELSEITQLIFTNLFHASWPLLRCLNSGEIYFNAKSNDREVICKYSIGSEEASCSEQNRFYKSSMILILDSNRLIHTSYKDQESETMKSLKVKMIDYSQSESFYLDIMFNFFDISPKSLSSGHFVEDEQEIDLFLDLGSHIILFTLNSTTFKHTGNVYSFNRANQADSSCHPTSRMHENAGKLFMFLSCDSKDLIVIYEEEFLTYEIQKKSDSSKLIYHFDKKRFYFAYQFNSSSINLWNTTYSSIGVISSLELYEDDLFKIENNANLVITHEDYSYDLKAFPCIIESYEQFNLYKLDPSLEDSLSSRRAKCRTKMLENITINKHFLDFSRIVQHKNFSQKNDISFKFKKLRMPNLSFNTEFEHLRLNNSILPVKFTNMNFTCNFSEGGVNNYNLNYTLLHYNPKSFPEGLQIKSLPSTHVPKDPSKYFGFGNDYFYNLPHVEQETTFYFKIQTQVFLDEAEFQVQVQKHEKVVRLTISENCVANCGQCMSICPECQTPTPQNNSDQSGCRKCKYHYEKKDQDETVITQCVRQKGSFVLLSFTHISLTVVLCLIVVLVLFSVIPYTVLWMIVEHYQELNMFYLAYKSSKGYLGFVVTDLYERIFQFMFPYYLFVFPFEITLKFLITHIDCFYALYAFVGIFLFIFAIGIFKKPESNSGIHFHICRIYLDLYVPFMILIVFDTSDQRIIPPLLIYACFIICIILSLLFETLLLIHWPRIVMNGKAIPNNGLRCFYQGLRHQAGGYLYHPLAILKRLFMISLFAIDRGDFPSKWAYVTNSVIQFLWLAYISYLYPFKFRKNYFLTCWINIIQVISQIQICVNSIAMVLPEVVNSDFKIILVQLTLVPFSYILFLILCGYTLIQKCRNTSTSKSQLLKAFTAKFKSQNNSSEQISEFDQQPLGTRRLIV
ncbi:unnamed protein product [Moneuplotes crassus]|uniref:4Fe-4S ferredoxin-type domain-containing protein n=1 Tax=Euplotes crassus TaxID=5936 RepID=A0AAD1XL21_EUPCR|nr:unnamed protein product [Moneuplotes crassus]